MKKKIVKISDQKKLLKNISVTFLSVLNQIHTVVITIYSLYYNVL